ncbi:MAG TPA: secretin N-terminal domain-containing protein [Vicinamibacteria bacterium]|jgi:type IV pilus assembly protein PilQ
MELLLASLLLGFFQEAGETLIDIDVREADVQDVLRLLAEVGGFNLAVDPGVTCKSTVKLKQVPWPQVLELTLRTCGLEQERLGENLVRVAPAEELRKEYEARRKYQEEKSLAGPLETRYVRLAYGKARDLAPILERFLSPRGSVVFDERTNTLIVTDVRR